MLQSCAYSKILRVPLSLVDPFLPFVVQNMVRAIRPNQRPASVRSEPMSVGRQAAFVLLQKGLDFIQKENKIHTHSHNTLRADRYDLTWLLFDSRACSWTLCWAQRTVLESDESSKFHYSISCPTFSSMHSQPIQVHGKSQFSTNAFKRAMRARRCTCNWRRNVCCTRQTQDLPQQKVSLTSNTECKLLIACQTNALSARFGNLSKTFWTRNWYLVFPLAIRRSDG
jgi:hypothetical protein